MRFHDAQWLCGSDWYRFLAALCLFDGCGGSVPLPPAQSAEESITIDRKRGRMTVRVGR